MRAFLIVILSFALLMSNQNDIKAQEYQSAIGLRGGYPAGITFKHFVSQEGALELILSAGWRGFMVTGLYEHHFAVPGADGLYWYIGGGGYFATINRGHHPVFGGEGVVADVGVAFVGGMEFKFPEVPFTISLDIVPAVGFYGLRNRFNYLGLVNAGLSVRYTFR